MVWDHANEPVSKIRTNKFREASSHSNLPLAIDEEFVSQLKLIEANMKRMQALLVSYEEQKADLRPEEKNDRHFVIQLLREALKLLRHDYEQQTKRFELGGGYRQVASPTGYID